MSNVIPIRPVDPVEQAWQRYQVLAVAFRDDPAKAADRAHVQAMASAYNDFLKTFTRAA